MIFTILLAISGLTLSAVAIYYSVIGLTAIFAAAFWPIVIMGTTLEISKLVAASWLKAYWTQIPRTMKIYMTTAVVVLMLITSMGIFGFLSKAHLDQNMVSGDVVDKVAIIDEKIKTQRDNIDAARKALRQMDEAVDQTMSRSTSEQGADKAANLRRSQQRERTNLQNDIAKSQAEIAKLNEQRAPIAKDLRAVEAEVGPIKYIAKLIYGDNPDANLLEKAVTWVIMIIIFVFDPLAVLMLLASQMTYQWWKKDSKETTKEVEDIPADPKSIETEPLEESTAQLTEEQERPSGVDWQKATALWPFGSFAKKEENVFDIIKNEERVQQAPYHPGYEDVTIKDDAGLTEEVVEEPKQVEEVKQVNNTVELDSQDTAESEEDDPKMTVAKSRWKDEYPNDSLKHQRKLLALGLIDKLPWEDPKYLDPEPADETEEPKKKDTYIVKEQDHQVTKTKN